MYIHAFIANHIQISMYKLTINNQHHLHVIIQQRNSIHAIVEAKIFLMNVLMITNLME